jgi:hypothetical protein
MRVCHRECFVPSLLVIFTVVLLAIFSTPSLAQFDLANFYRVNVGGAMIPATDGADNWREDTAANPAPWLVAGGENFFTSNVGAVDVSMIPPTINLTDPQALFQFERWDPPTAPEMQWAFPVDNGVYLVRLFFAEIYSGACAVGPGFRVIDVDVEGIPGQIDPYAAANACAKASMLQFVVGVTDSELNINFTHNVENPALKGIEIRPEGSVSTEQSTWGRIKSLYRNW